MNVSADSSMKMVLYLPRGINSMTVSSKSYFIFRLIFFSVQQTSFFACQEDFMKESKEKKNIESTININDWMERNHVWCSSKLHFFKMYVYVLLVYFGQNRFSHPDASSVMLIWRHCVVNISIKSVYNFSTVQRGTNVMQITKWRMKVHPYVSRSIHHSKFKLSKPFRLEMSGNLRAAGLESSWTINVGKRSLSCAPV